MGRPTDPAIEEIEAQLRESQFKTWDVETFLANRHQAKIEALNAKIETLNEPRGKWIAAKDIAMAIAFLGLALVGFSSVMQAGVGWAKTGTFSLVMRPQPAPIVINPIPPMPACPLPETTQQ